MIKISLVFAATFVLVSCADLNFRKDNVQAGLLEIGQEVAHHRCKNTGNYQDYQSCVRQVDQNYGEAYK